MIYHSMTPKMNDADIFFIDYTPRILTKKTGTYEEKINFYLIILFTTITNYGMSFSERVINILFTGFAKLL